MSKRVRILIFLFGFAVFAYLVADFGIGAIVRNVARTGWWFIPIIALWSVMYLCNAWALQTIIAPGPAGPRFSTTYAVTVTGFALNYVTPLINLGGEPYRVVVLREMLGMHRAVSSIILYNMVRMLSHFFFWFLGIVLVMVWIPYTREYLPVLAAISVLVILLMMLFFSRLRHGIFESLLAFLQRTRWLHPLSRRLARRSPGLLAIDTQIRTLYNQRRGAFYGALALEFAARVIGSLEFYFIGVAIDLPLSFADALYINAASSLILNLMFFVPFEIGAREGGLYLVMKSLGHAPGLGIYMGLVNRVRELFWILVGLLLMQLSGRTAARHERINLMEQSSNEGPPV